MRKYVCSDLKRSTLSRLRYRRVLIGPIFPSRRLAAAATFHTGTYISSPLLSNSGSSSSSSSLLECLRAACVWTVSVLRHIDRRAFGPFRAKICTPHPEYGQLAKICTGNLTGSELRKYALCQNHTIPVRIGRKTEKCKSQEMPPPAPTSTLSHTECSTTSGKTNECRITRYCTHNVFLKFLF